MNDYLHSISFFLLKGTVLFSKYVRIVLNGTYLDFVEILIYLFAQNNLIVRKYFFFMVLNKPRYLCMPYTASQTLFLSNVFFLKTHNIRYEKTFICAGFGGM